MMEGVDPPGADQEKWKRAENPLDAYARLTTQAGEGAYPKPEDNFRWRYHGLFYVAPAQNSFMCRLRLPNGILNHWRFAGLADLADRFAGAYACLAEGAHVYVCGDAKRMAKDVEAALVDVVATHGVRTTDEAIAFVQGLKRSGRYQADVY